MFQIKPLVTFATVRWFPDLSPGLWQLIKHLETEEIKASRRGDDIIRTQVGNVEIAKMYKDFKYLSLLMILLNLSMVLFNGRIIKRGRGSMVLISSWLIWSISWKYPRLCNDLGNIKVLFNAMTLELFHRIHCGAMQYSFENKIHFVLVTFNGRVVFRSIGCLRSETTWVRKIRSEKQRERSLAAWGLLPPLPMLIIMSEGIVTPQPDSGSYWLREITWPAVSSLIGCRQTTCGLSPSSLQTVLRIWSPWRCNYASLIVSQVTSWPLSLTSGHCSMSLYSPHKCPLSTDP